jgi:hypothetical protein
MMMSSSGRERNTLTISRLAAKLLPLPGVPRNRPFGDFYFRTAHAGTNEGNAAVHIRALAYSLNIPHTVPDAASLVGAEGNDPLVSSTCF